jgi:hypothetical protein
LRVVSAWNRCAGWTLIRAKTPPNAQGTLEIDGTSFSGQVSGFAPGDRLDFADLAFGSKTTVEYDVTTHHLTVSDGVKVADVTLLGTYTASTFVTADDGHGGTLVTLHAHHDGWLLSA